jgi:hypothetical protein
MHGANSSSRIARIALCACLLPARPSSPALTLSASGAARALKNRKIVDVINDMVGSFTSIESWWFVSVVLSVPGVKFQYSQNIKSILPHISYPSHPSSASLRHHIE